MTALEPKSCAADDGRLRMLQQPVFSPDGSTIAFSYGGNLWRVPATGGRAEPLTAHPANDETPQYSRDGKWLAFVSDRDGQDAIYRMPVDGGVATRVTYHSEGYQLHDWFPDNDHVLATGTRDHFWRHSSRLFRIRTDTREKEQLLANAYAYDASVSADGKRVLFVREGERWWRKGYYGSRSAQIWMLDLETEEFRLVLSETYDCRWPRWIGEKNSFVFTRGMAHGFELCRFDIGDGDDAPNPSGEEPTEDSNSLVSLSGQITQLTDFGAESVVFPSVSADGSKVVFRHLFDTYTLSLDEDVQRPPTRVDVLAPVDSAGDEQIRRSLRDASDAAFTQDGLEMALVAGGDLWVMDTKLREPRRVTEDAGWDESPVFSIDGETLFAIRDVKGRKDVYRIERQDSDLHWWQNESFVVTNLTRDAASESDLTISPDGKRLFFVRGRGDLVHTDLEGKDRVRLTRGFSPPDYDVSPDGAWVAYDQLDDQFNSEVFIVDTLGKREPYNVSRHPDDDASPRFSRDGKLLAFTGRRIDREVDIYYVWLQAEQRDKTSRQRKLEEALELIEKSRKKTKKKQNDNDKSDDVAAEEKDEQGKRDDKDDDTDARDEDSIEPVVIDFERLHERLQRISIADTTERSLIWDPKDPRLVFTAAIDGDRGLYSITFPDELTPEKFSSATGRPIAWTKDSDGLLILDDGIPTLVKGKDTEKYTFTARQDLQRSERLTAAFDVAWRTMRDRWYDPKTGGRNWGAVRRKYKPVAATLPDEKALAELILLMLGELNGSHNGFSPRSNSSTDSSQDWSESTAHLGVRFDPSFTGPGLQIRDVIRGGPADKADSRMHAGEIILSIDGHEVDIDMDLTTVLNGRLDRDVRLVVRSSEEPNDGEDDFPEEDQGKETPEEKPDEDAEDTSDDDEKDGNGDREAAKDSEPETEDDGERTVVIRPISYGAARGLLYEDWIEFNRTEVDRLSDGKLGYLHIRAMNMSSFYEFERQLYAAGYQRDGLVIDVRENGGGSTTDLLLTCLTQPAHATTIPRSGGPGYPQSRLVYASWNKPIIVLCNQNSYSNAEIFSHAIKSLGRGRLVGVPTAGGVISTGAVSIMDVGVMRMPFRAWFVTSTGEDMEMAGAEPGTIVWPAPGEMPTGNDKQLSVAVSQLLEDVAKWKANRPPKRVYATEREAPAPQAAPLAR